MSEVVEGIFKKVATELENKYEYLAAVFKNNYFDLYRYPNTLHIEVIEDELHIKGMVKDNTYKHMEVMKLETIEIIYAHDPDCISKLYKIIERELIDAPVF